MTVESIALLKVAKELSRAQLDFYEHSQEVTSYVDQLTGEEERLDSTTKQVREMECVAGGK